MDIKTWIKRHDKNVKNTKSKTYYKRVNSVFLFTGWLPRCPDWFPVTWRITQNYTELFPFPLLHKTIIKLSSVFKCCFKLVLPKPKLGFQTCSYGSLTLQSLGSGYIKSQVAIFTVTLFKRFRTSYFHLIHFAIELMLYLQFYKPSKTYKMNLYLIVYGSSNRYIHIKRFLLKANTLFDNLQRQLSFHFI